MEQDAPSSPPQLKFHPDFSIKAAGDIILLSDDGTAFYLRSTQLSELSTFFSTLPIPSDADLVDGTPVIALHGATDDGLHILLLAIKSTTSSAPFRLPNLPSNPPIKAILSAAAIARRFDISIAYRILCEGVEEEPIFRYPGLLKPYLRFAIWAIGDVESKLPGVAKETIEKDGYAISCIPDTLQEMCRIHAPLHWAQLVDFHMRRAKVMERYRRKLNETKNLYRPFPAHADCKEAGGPAGARTRSHAMLAQAPDLKAVNNAAHQLFGLECEDCQDAAALRYDDLVMEVKSFGTEYIYDYASSS